MKRGKLLTVATASVLALSLAAGGVYAWFVSKKVSATVDVETGKIAICSIPQLVESSNHLPGESIPLNPAGHNFNNRGTRDVVIRLSFKDHMKGYLKQGKEPEPAFSNDYEYDVDKGAYRLKPERLEAVIDDLAVDTSNFPDDLYEFDGDYYFFLTSEAPNSASGPLYYHLILGGELGGGASDGSGGLTPLRKFEQGSSFEVAIEAYAVQATRAACVDIFGQAATDSLPDTFFNS